MKEVIFQDLDLPAVLNTGELLNELAIAWGCNASEISISTTSAGEVKSWAYNKAGKVEETIQIGKAILLRVPDAIVTGNFPELLAAHSPEKSDSEIIPDISAMATKIAALEAKVAALEAGTK